MGELPNERGVFERRIARWVERCMLGHWGTSDMQDEQVQGRGSVILALGCQRASAYSTLTALLLLP